MIRLMEPIDPKNLRMRLYPLLQLILSANGAIAQAVKKKDDVKNSGAVLLATKPVPLARLAMRRPRARVPHRFFHSVEAPPG
jgi:hypothetical protein